MNETKIDINMENVPISNNELDNKYTRSDRINNIIFGIVSISMGIMLVVFSIELVKVGCDRDFIYPFIMELIIYLLIGLYSIASSFTNKKYTLIYHLFYSFCILIGIIKFCLLFQSSEFQCRDKDGYFTQLWFLTLVTGITDLVIGTISLSRILDRFFNR